MCLHQNRLPGGGDVSPKAIAGLVPVTGGPLRTIQASFSSFVSASRVLWMALLAEGLFPSFNTSGGDGNYKEHTHKRIKIRGSIIF